MGTLFLGNHLRELKTAVPDALKLAQIIQKQHETLKPYYQKQNRYKVQLFLNENASLSQLKQLIADLRQGVISIDNEKVTVTKDDRLFFYFAGHGLASDALENQEGPVGYLIPQDAISGNSNTYLPMQELHDALNALPCRHMLAILDCCFAGAFRWASLQREIVPKVKVYKERYDRFISDRAWQVITSASDTQKALDSLGVRGGVKEGSEVYSPFAKALFDALQGSADESADLNKDNIITATELYLYLRDRVEILTEKHYQRQTPSLCPLKKHDKGEFIFLLPDFDRDTLEDAPPLNAENNPYRGLQSYDEEHSHLFFGRENLIDKLYQKVVDNNQALTLVLGASGTGKSSLVKAGLLKRLRDSQEPKFEILAPMRPGETPLKALAKVCCPILTTKTASELEESKHKQGLVKIIEHWSQDNPGTKVLLAVDQFEELITVCKSDKERKQFQQLLENTIAKYPDKIHVVITLRLDFEAQFQNSVLKDFWNDDTRFVVPPMTQDEFREAIEKPALERVLYFEPPSLVDELINEVVQMPGALPLLSFTLSELYLKYLGDRTRNNRALTKQDYEDLGRVVGSITKRANEEYDCLVKDPAYKNTIRRVMLRMISLQGGELARRQVPKSELVYPDEEENERVQTVIKSFSQARLIVEGSNSQGEPYVEPAHDALVRGWDKLLAWKKEEEENLILQRRLTPDAQEWNKVKSKEQLSGFKAKAEPIIGWLDSRLYTVENLFNKIPAQIASLWRKIQNRNIRFWQIYLLMWAVKSRSYSLMRYSSVKVGCFHRQNQQERSREKPVQFLWNANPYLDVLNQQLQSNDNWFNKVEDEFVQQSVLQKRRNISWRWRIAIGVILGLSGLTITALIGQRDAQIGQIEAFRQSAEANFVANRQLEALIDALRAGKILEYNPLVQVFKPDTQFQNQVTKILYQALSETNECNRLERAMFPVKSAKFSPNGQYIITVSDEDIARVWNLQGKLVTRLEGHQGSIKSAEFSPNSQYVVTVPSYSTTARVWNLQGNLVGELKWHGDKLADHSAKFSPNGKYIVTASDKDIARVWNLQGNLVAELKGHQGSVKSAEFSPNSQYVVTTSNDNTAQVWKVQVWNLEGKLITEIKGQQGSIKSAEFSPNSQYVVTVPSYSTTAWLWNLQGKWVKEFRHEDSVNSAEFSPNGQYVVTTSNDNTARVWNLQDDLVAKLKEHQDSVKSAEFSPNGQYIVTASDDYTARVWNLQGDLVVELKGHQDSVNSVEFSPNSQYIVTASDDYTARVWNLQNDLVTELKGHEDSVYSTEFSPNGQYVVTTSDEDIARVWNLQGKLVKELGHEYSVKSAKFSPNSQYIVTVPSDATTARVWNLQGKWVKEFRHEDSVNSAEFSPNGQYVVTTSNDNTAKMWNLQGKLVKELKGHEDSVYSARFSPNSQYVVTVSEKTALVWDLQGQLVTRLEGHQDFLNSAKFSPNSQYIVTASNDEGARVWNLQGQLVAEAPESYRSGVISTEFSPNGQHIVIASDDKTVLLWNLQDKSFKELLHQECGRRKCYDEGRISAEFSPNGQYIIIAALNDKTAQVLNLQGDLLLKLKGHQGSVYSAKFSPNGQYIITASNDKTARVWRFRQFNELLTLGCQRVRDYLKNNPNVNPSNRRICDGIRVSKHNELTPVAAPISSIPSPAPYPNDQTSVPGTSETATTSSLTQEAAVDLVKTWLQEKNKVLAPPFDLQVLARYTTGRYFQKSQKALDWLKSNNAYYQFKSPLVSPIGIFSVEGNQANVGVRVTESLSLYSQGRAKPNQHTTEYNLTLQLENGQWKIEDSQQLSP